MDSTWREMINEAAAERGERIIQDTLTDGEAVIEIDKGHIVTRGEGFTAWSENYVFFPICYDGVQWVGSAPRNPCNEVTTPMGGM